MNPESTPAPFVAYFRVSTQKQGVSGLGLDAQRRAVRSFAGAVPIIAEFTEIESGKKNARPQLEAAIECARVNGARLVIAKLDRLSRNAVFTLRLMESKVGFVCVDMPGANEMTIGIIAIINQDEAKRISERTKAALASKKAQGFKLGTPANLTDDARAKGRAAHVANARTARANMQAADVARDKRAQGLSLGKIAASLNGNGYRTRNGKEFQRTTVLRLLAA